MKNSEKILPAGKIINPKSQRIISITSPIAENLWKAHLKGEVKVDPDTLKKLIMHYKKIDNSQNTLQKPSLLKNKLIGENNKQKNQNTLEKTQPNKNASSILGVKPKVISEKHNVKTIEYKKPKSPVHLNTIDIKITVKKASKEDLQKFNKKLDAAEVNGYDLKNLENDIKNDAFVQDAVNAHMKALNSKISIYEKLSKVKWGDQAPVIGAPPTANIRNIISEMLLNLNLSITNMKAMSNADLIKQKREVLQNIMYDDDNGIATIRGKSREGVKVAIIKLIYMFFKVPDFFFKGFINFMITGPAGSGKTKVASVIAYVMQNLGILATNNVTMATKQTLVAPFLGQTGQKTRKILSESIEGVLFIDEAYSLTPCPTAPVDLFAEEAVAELINFMDKFIGCMVIIVAGYKKQMYECFLTFNEGIGRRFPKMINLENYNTDDLYMIFEKFLSESIEINKFITRDQQIYIKSVISVLNNENIFNNQAGDMLNLSKIIGEDAVLTSGKYSNELIIFSFQKFCAGKEYIIEYE
jgi:hypothetical protein